MIHCIQRAVAGLAAGTLADQPAREVLHRPETVDQLRELAHRLAEEFPEELEGLPAPPFTEEDAERILGKG